MADDSALSRILQRIRRAFGGETGAFAPQAAALAWRRADGPVAEVLLITSRGTGRWVLPKGWIEDGEDKAAAAAREAWEEAGIKGSLTPEPVGTYVYRKTDGETVQSCHVTVYALAVEHQADDWPERAERDRKWVPAARAAQLVDEPDLKALLDAFGTGWRKLAA